MDRQRLLPPWAELLHPLDRLLVERDLGALNAKDTEVVLQWRQCTQSGIPAERRPKPTGEIRKFVHWQRNPGYWLPNSRSRAVADGNGHILCT